MVRVMFRSVGPFNHKYSIVNFVKINTAKMVMLLGWRTPKISSGFMSVSVPNTPFPPSTSGIQDIVKGLTHPLFPLFRIFYKLFKIAEFLRNRSIAM